MTKSKIKPFKGITSLGIDGDGELLQFIESMGYFIYEDPTAGNEDAVIISHKKVLFRDLKKFDEKAGVNHYWWKDLDTCLLNEELDKLTF